MTDEEGFNANWHGANPKPNGAFMPPTGEQYATDPRDTNGKYRVDFQTNGHTGQSCYIVRIAATGEPVRVSGYRYKTGWGALRVGRRWLDRQIRKGKLL